jgi:GT2 family glycosyltransferase
MRNIPDIAFQAAWPQAGAAPQCRCGEQGNLSVGVVIVSYRTGPTVSACLHALSRVAGLDEIILVDNGNAPAETRVLDAFAAVETRALLLRGHGNVGFARGCNMGAAVARSDTLVFANPDVILEPDALTRLEAVLAAAPSPAIVGGDLRDGAGRPERGSRRERLTLWRAFVAFTGLSRLERAAPVFRDFNRHVDPLPAEPVRVGAVSGALLAMRRADFEAIGGFDTGYFVHVEDLDLCRRAEELGWPVVFAPGPHGRHVRSTSAVAAQVVARHKADGLARYFSKFAHGPVDRALAHLAGGFLRLVWR